MSGLDMRDREIYNLQQEVKFLLERAERASKISFASGWDRFTGISSNALVTHVWAGTLPDKGEYPSDTADLVSCWNTVQMVPAHRKAKALEILEMYEQHIRAKDTKYWERYIQVIEGRDSRGLDQEEG